MSNFRRFRATFEPLEDRRLLTVPVQSLGFSSVEGQTESSSVWGEDYNGIVGFFEAFSPLETVLSNDFATVDWGDGTPRTFGVIIADPNNAINRTYHIQATHPYAEIGNYTVRVTIFDGRDFSTSGPAIAKITDAPLTPTSLVLKPIEGTSFTDTAATFTDANSFATAADFSATIDWGDGHSSVGVVTANSSGGFNVTGTNTYAEEGSYDVAVSIKDKSGSATSTHSSALVSDAPLLGVPAPISATENAALTNVVIATFTDTGGADPSTDYTVSINWGDGTPVDTRSGMVDAAGGNFTVRGSHTFAHVGHYSTTVTISDENPSGGIPASVVTVVDSVAVNDAPLIAMPTGPVNATAGTPLAIGSLVTFTDAGLPGAAGDYEAAIDWGDGTPATSGQIATNGSTFIVSGLHTFTTPGSYTGRVTVRDFGGAVTTAAFTTTVAPVTLSFVPLDATERQTLVNVVAATLQSAGGTAAAAGLYTVTIDWGDLTQPTPGIVTTSGSILNVIGSHRYAESGTYTMRVVIGVPNNPNLLVTTQVTTVADIPIILTGQLNGASDSGMSVTDGVTNVTKPNYHGTSEPLSTIKLYATPVADGAAMLIGQGTTDSSGFWSINASPLANGRYTISAEATDEAGVTTATATLANGTAGGPLVINAITPRVSIIPSVRPNLGHRRQPALARHPVVFSHQHPLRSPQRPHLVHFPRHPGKPRH